MLAIILEIVVFAFLRARNLMLLSVGWSIGLGVLWALIPGGATIIFIVLKLKSLLLIGWGWIAIPIILDFFEIGDLLSGILPTESN